MYLKSSLKTLFLVKKVCLNLLRFVLDLCYYLFLFLVVDLGKKENYFIYI